MVISRATSILRGQKRDTRVICSNQLYRLKLSQQPQQNSFLTIGKMLKGLKNYLSFPLFRLVSVNLITTIMCMLRYISEDKN